MEVKKDKLEVEYQGENTFKNTRTLIEVNDAGEHLRNIQRVEHSILMKQEQIKEEEKLLAALKGEGDYLYNKATEIEKERKDKIESEVAKVKK